VRASACARAVCALLLLLLHVCALCGNAFFLFIKRASKKRKEGAGRQARARLGL